MCKTIVGMLARALIKDENQRLSNRHGEDHNSRISQSVAEKTNGFLFYSVIL